MTTKFLLYIYFNIFMANATQLSQFQYAYVYVPIFLKISTMYNARLMNKFNS